MTVSIPDPVHPSWQSRFGCPVCDRKSFSLADYRGHYALAHILGLPDDPTLNTPPPDGSER